LKTLTVCHDLKQNTPDSSTPGARRAQPSLLSEQMGFPSANARHPLRKTETAAIRVGFQSHRPDGIVTTKPYRTTPAAGGYSDLQF